jgi:large subunit ribosomal protein L4
MKLEIDVYNQEGEKTGVLELDPEIFDVKLNKDLIHQVVVSLMANKRQNWAHTKTRGEVRGGGRKPWPQKGLGLARHGSIRSPIWKGGGVVFGPRKNKIYKKKIPKKMKRKALFSVLSEKLRRKLIIVFESLNLDQPKTKKLVQLINLWKNKIKNFKNGSILFVIPKKDKNLELAASNLPKVEVVTIENLNVLTLLSFKYLIFLKEAIKKLKEIYKK